MIKTSFKKSFFLKIILPALSAIILYVFSIFIFIIPAFEENVLNEKKIMLQELTNTAWSILNKYSEEVNSGNLNLTDAQHNALKSIESLRYGAENKDYFWITDMTPTMLMHPYVHELNGKSLQEFSDPDGVKLFIEAKRIVSINNEGFISYRWQFKDENSKIVPKLSYVKGFKKWNWIIGTGIYLEDLQLEIDKLTKKIIFISISIILIISLIIVFITIQSLSIEKQRLKVELRLRESREKYKALIESSTEGIILLINNKISYANAFILNWLGYSANEIQNLNLNDLIVSEIDFSTEDLHEEIQRQVKVIKKSKTVTDTILTVLPVQFAEKKGILLTFKNTEDSQKLKQSLEDLSKTYTNMVTYTNICFFRFSLSKSLKITDFSKNVINLLGYSSEEEFRQIKLDKIIADISDLKKIIKDLPDNENFVKRKINLKNKSGSNVFVNLTIVSCRNEYENNIFYDGIIEPITYDNASQQPNLLNEMFYSLSSFLNQAVLNLKNKVVSCSYDTPLMQVFEIMTFQKSEYILAMKNEECIGTFTSSDLIKYINNSDFSLSIPLYKVMNTPVHTISENVSISDIYAKFLFKANTVINLSNARNEITGVYNLNFNEKQLISSQLMNGIINNCKNIDELIIIRNQLPALIKPILNQIASSIMINRLISSINDLIANKIIAISVMETGVPPVEFSFITFGSAGREELVLNSDQDNALIFSDVSSESIVEIEKYFYQLSDRICKYLDKSGLPLCKGGYMANNNKWCKPLSVWKEYFVDWIENTEPSNLLNISVFFDLRLVYGSQLLFNELENHNFNYLKGKTAFFYNLAQSILNFKPPINFFGGIITEVAGKNIEILDVKNCIASVVLFTRIFSLSNGIRNTNTINRIKELEALNVLSETTADELEFHFNFLTQLRLKHQTEQFFNNINPDNNLNPKKMSEMELFILKKVFSQMNGYQSKITASFMQ